MNAVIVGAGMIPVGEHWSKGIGELASEAGAIALKDAGISSVDALYVGNAYGAAFNQQTQLGSLIAGDMNLTGIEAYTCEAGEASGGVALRTGCLAVASGMVQSALVIGVEKATDIVGAPRVSAAGISLDADFESVNGATLTAMAGLLMRRYMHEYGLELPQFEGFSLNAHRNGAMNPFAMYRNRLRAGAFAKVPMIADPVNLFDRAPEGDGAAAVVLVSSDAAADLVPKPISISASSVAADHLMLQDREQILTLKAVHQSVKRALEQARLTIDSIDLMELHDAYTILTALTLEAMGLGEAGRGWSWANDGGTKIGLDGAMPISAFGGLKSRGNPSGATGIYQAVEAVWQLRREAGANQVDGAKTALIQSIGGLGSTVVTHILRVFAD